MYQVAEKDLIGDLEGFPLKVVQKMVERQVEQGNKADVRAFQKTNAETKREGGFNWCDTEEDYDFWVEVIEYQKFNTFFQKYPKQTSTTKTNKIMTQDKTTTPIERDYLIFLSDSKVRIENNPKFSLYKYTRQCRKNSNISQILQDMNVVKTEGKSANTKYYWIGTNPTIEMVREVLVRQQELSVKSNPKNQVMYFFSYESETEVKEKVFKGSENGLVNRDNKEVELFKRISDFKKNYGRDVLITNIKFV